MLFVLFVEQRVVTVRHIMACAVLCAGVFDVGLSDCRILKYLTDKQTDNRQTDTLEANVSLRTGAAAPGSVIVATLYILWRDSTIVAESHVL